MLRDYEAYGTRWMSLRYFNAAGADAEGDIGEMHDPETHAIPLAILAALGRAPSFELYGTDYPRPMDRQFATTFMLRIWRRLTWPPFSTYRVADDRWH
jgi:hypothetical protein